MNVFVKLNPGQGINLGENFILAANVGTLVPATATLNELLEGVYVVANNSATEIYVTSEGICTNTLTLPILTTTSTTTTAHFTASTSSVSAYEACSNPEAPSYTFNVIGGIGTSMCDNIQIRSIYIELLNPGSLFWTYNGLNVKEWQVLLSPSGYNYAVGYSSCTSCPTTTTTSTTTAAPTTTTTTVPVPVICINITFDGNITHTTETAYWTDCDGTERSQLVPANTTYGPVCAIIDSISGQEYVFNSFCSTTTTTTTIAP